LPDSIKQKIVNAQTIYEAMVLAGLAQENHSVLQGICQNSPLDWNIHRPLCKHCWQELATENDVCSLCREILARMEGLTTKTDTGILVSCQSAEDVANALVASSIEPSVDSNRETISLISQKELLVLLPCFLTASFLTALQETAPCLSIVFPGYGDMNFGDALAMARYFARNAEASESQCLTKFFFSHSHMRAFDMGDFFPFDFTKELFETASAIKSVFSKDDRNLICDLLKKDRVNRVYELNRFYSLCNPDQKHLLSRLQVDNSEPNRLLLLFQLVRYVYRNN
jgi:hypothetical protein